MKNFIIFGKNPEQTLKKYYKDFCNALEGLSFYLTYTNPNFIISNDGVKIRDGLIDNNVVKLDQMNLHEGLINNTTQEWIAGEKRVPPYYYIIKNTNSKPTSINDFLIYKASTPATYYTCNTSQKDDNINLIFNFLPRAETIYGLNYHFNIFETLGRFILVDNHFSNQNRTVVAYEENYEKTQFNITYNGSCWLGTKTIQGMLKNVRQGFGEEIIVDQKEIVTEIHSGNKIIPAYSIEADINPDFTVKLYTR